MDLSKFFTDPQIHIITLLKEGLKEDNTKQVRDLEDQVVRLRTTVEQLVDVCEAEDVFIVSCQSCKGLGSMGDTFTCEGCDMKLCYRCNDLVGHIGTEQDGAERCLECHLLHETLI
jgi:hypothetical protein